MARQLAEEFDVWAKRSSLLASGDAPRDVYLYVISGQKVLNQLAAMGIIERP
jgi:hypothetical protein